MADDTTIDALMQSLRQGDYVIGDCGFLFLGRDHSADAADQIATPVAAVLQRVHGLVLVSQSCDIVRGCRQRPYVEFAPLVVADPATMNSVIRRRSNQFVALSSETTAHNRVVDLDRVMTVEKAVAANWQFGRGLETDEEVRTFARCLARKRQRAAFPAELRAMLQPLRRDLEKKHRSPAVEAIAKLFEIRVRPSPNWHAPRVVVEFWLVSEPADGLGGTEVTAVHDAFAERIAAAGNLVVGPIQITSLVALTAADYLSSDHLEFDDLTWQSSPQEPYDR